MSLGIVLIENNDIYLMADTQLSFPEKSGKKPYFGLKIFFLDKHTAIAYSGTAGEIAHGRIYAIYKQGYKGDLNILAKQISQSFDHNVDFLLAQSGNMPSIAKITERSVSIQSGKGIYWIGDGEAAGFVANSATHDIHSLKDRLNNVISSSQFATIGGNVVIARGGINGFRFIPYMELFSPRDTAIEKGWKTVDFGTAQTGGFGFTTVVPIKEGVNGWGIFYFQGKFGNYWHVDLETNVGELLKAHARSVKEFVEIIQKEIGIELEFCGNLE